MPVAWIACATPRDLRRALQAGTKFGGEEHGDPAFLWSLSRRSCPSPRVLHAHSTLVAVLKDPVMDAAEQAVE
jgi:hypothetical protein